MRGAQAIRRQVPSRAQKPNDLPLPVSDRLEGSSLSSMHGGVTRARIHSSMAASQLPGFTPAGTLKSSQLLANLLLSPDAPATSAAAAAATVSPTAVPLQQAAAVAAVPHGQYNGSWTVDDTLLARIFGGFPHLPCSHSQDVAVVCDLIHTFSDFVLHLGLESQQV